VTLPLSELKYPVLAIKSSVQSLDYRTNSYHIHLNYLDLHTRDREISLEYPYSNRSINKSLLNARLLPLDSNPRHSLFPAATPTNNCATSTSKNIPQRQPRVSSCTSILLKTMAINFDVPAVCFTFIPFYCDSFCPCKFI
jgi:hypothetical protein